MAIGMVMNTAKVPQALRSSAWTTTIDRPAMVMVMMNSIASPVHQPATGPSSDLATSDSDLPWCFIEANSTTVSCTAPPTTQPISSHRKLGR